MSTDSLVGFDGPIRETTLAFRGVEVPLVRPAEPDRLLDDPAVHERNRRDDYMPYWAYLWPGAFLLADALAEGGPLVDQECLELGCGLGLAGLVALRQGAHVRFTDYDEVPLAFVAATARFQRARCSVPVAGGMLSEPASWRSLTRNSGVAKARAVRMYSRNSMRGPACTGMRSVSWSRAREVPPRRR